MMCGEAWLKHGDPWKYERATQNSVSCSVSPDKQKQRRNKSKMVKQQQAQLDF